MRHGETPWNKERRLQGRHGADLDEEGVLLAEITRDGMRDIPFDICYTSPLVRARHTAEIVIGDRDIPIVDEPRIMEISFGEWEGRSCDLNHLEIPRENYLAYHLSLLKHHLNNKYILLHLNLHNTKQMQNHISLEVSLQ